MADVWCGNILLPDGTAVTDITLASQNVASSPTIPTTALRFLTTVDTARIPLYLAAGPSMDVWTSSEATEEWFSSLLLSESATVTKTAAQDATRKWWAFARAQSPLGILAKLEEQQVGSLGPKVSEILFYGTVATPTQAGLPTPPSSSPDLPHLRPESLPQLRVHALPLSSDLLHQRDLDIPPLPGLDPSTPPASIEPQFLSPHTFGSLPTSPKRKRDIFEEATEARKRARGKGGEGVAAAAAKAQDSQHTPGHRKSLSIDTKTMSLSDSRPNSAQGLRGRPSSRHMSRSPSLSSEVRPMSRKGMPEGHTKRSTLSQVATVPLKPEEPTTETRNKEALSRVVMAAMRMHGLQQRKKDRSRRGSVAPGAQATEQLHDETTAEDAAKDEEYKTIYHQTYKGAVLALRKHISTKPLHSQTERLGDVVERLLAIFCTDPLAHPLTTNESLDPLATPGSKQKLGVPGSSHSRASPFDLPSGSRMNALKSVGEGQLNTGSPIRRKKTQENQEEAAQEGLSITVSSHGK